MLAKRPFGRTGLHAAPLGLAGSYGIDADGTERAHHELGVDYFFGAASRSSGLVTGIRRLVAAGHRERMVLAGASILFGTWKEMRKLEENGDVGALAISIHDCPMARRLVDELELDALMIRYNAAHRGAEKEIFATFEPATRPAVVAYTATRWGKLLQPLGDQGPLSGPECYRFAIGNPNVDVVLCGARTFDELRANAEGIARGPLPPERLAQAREFGDAVRATATGRVGWGGA